MEAYNKEQANRKLNAEAKALRETAISDADYQRERVQAAMQHRMIADHVIFTLGGVLESSHSYLETRRLSEDTAGAGRP